MNFSKRKIFVMRHATVQNPSDKVYSNLPGFPLSELGRRQANEAGRWLSTTPLQFIFTSGRERARETAEIVAGFNSGQPKVIVDEGLRDIDLGQYAGKIPFDDWRARRTMYWQKQINGEGGMESPVQVQARMLKTWRRVLADYPAANILFVSHADSLAILLESLENQVLQPTSEKTHGIGRANVMEIELGPPVRVRKVFVPTI